MTFRDDLYKKALKNAQKKYGNNKSLNIEGAVNHQSPNTIDDMELKYNSYSIVKEKYDKILGPYLLLKNTPATEENTYTTNSLKSQINSISGENGRDAYDNFKKVENALYSAREVLKDSLKYAAQNDAVVGGDVLKVVSIINADIDSEKSAYSQYQMKKIELQPWLEFLELKKPEDTSQYVDADKKGPKGPKGPG